MSADADVARAFEELLARRARGERVDAAELARRFPAHARELAAALESLDVLQHADDEPGGERDDEPLPERIGPYRIVRRVGRGGMGVVLEALEEPLGRRIALKILPPEHLASSVARERFRREAHVASRLEHPGIATVFGAGIDADVPWIALRFIEGESLAGKIAAARARGLGCVELGGAGSSDRSGASRRARPLHVARCIAAVARALQDAHEKGIVHRDVKPSNVMITPEGAPVLLDFGLALGAEADAPTLTRTGQTAGTPAYLPPELVSGESARHDARSDVYALGVTLYECLSLRRPFDGPTQVALYRAITSGTASSVSSLNRDVPRDLAVVVATAMERDPARRYRDAASLAADLEACVAGRPILARPLSLAGRVSRWARREPRQAVLASLLALAFVGLTFFGATWWSGRERVLAADRMDLEARFEEELRDGFASLATRRAGDAERNFARALALRPGSTEALVGRALVLIEEGRYDESAAVLEQAPDTPAIRALRAVAEGASPPLDLGAEWLATSPSIELFVDGLRIAKQAERAPRHERKRVHELAAARFEEAVSRSRGARAFFHVKRAFAARDAGDERGVRSAAAALATLWPGSARALFTAGNTLREFDRRASIELLRRSIALEPGWGPPHQNLGNAYYFERDYAAAIVELEEALRLDPRDADAWNTLGLSLAMHGCSDEARHAFHSALSLRPSFFEAWANLGWLDVNAGRYADAEPALRMALALAPHEPLPRSQLALVLHHRRDFQGEVAEREIVLGVAPHDRFSWAALSAALTSGGHPKEALRVAEVGLELSPGEPDLIRLRDIALSRIDPRELDD